MATPSSSHIDVNYFSAFHFNTPPTSSLLTKMKANEQSLAKFSIEEIKKFLSTINLDSSDSTSLTCLNSIDFSTWSRESISDLLTPIQVHLPTPLDSLNTINFMGWDSSEVVTFTLSFFKYFNKDLLIKLKARPFTPGQIAQINETFIDKAFLLSFFKDERERMIELTDAQIRRIDYEEIDPRNIPFFQKILKKMKNPPIPIIQALPKVSQSSSSSSSRNRHRGTSSTTASSSTTSSPIAGFSTTSVPKPASVSSIQAINFEHHDGTSVNLILKNMSEIGLRQLSTEMMCKNIRKINTEMRDRWIGAVRTDANLVHQVNILSLPIDVLLRFSASDFSSSQIKRIDFTFFSRADFTRFFSTPSSRWFKELSPSQVQQCRGLSLIPEEWLSELSKDPETVPFDLGSPVPAPINTSSSSSSTTNPRSSSVPASQMGGSTSSHSVHMNASDQVANFDLRITKMLKENTLNTIDMRHLLPWQVTMLLKRVERRLKELPVEQMCARFNDLDLIIRNEWLHQISNESHLIQQLNLPILPCEELLKFRSEQFLPSQIAQLKDSVFSLCDPFKESISRDSFLIFFSKRTNRTELDTVSLSHLNIKENIRFAFLIPSKYFDSLSTGQLETIKTICAKEPIRLPLVISVLHKRFEDNIRREILNRASLENLLDGYDNIDQVKTILRLVPPARMKELSIEKIYTRFRGLDLDMKEKWLRCIKDDKTLIRKLNLIHLLPDATVINTFRSEQFSISQLTDLYHFHFEPQWQFAHFFTLAGGREVDGFNLRNLLPLQISSFSSLIPSEWFNELTTAQLLQIDRNMLTDERKAKLDEVLASRGESIPGRQSERTSSNGAEREGKREAGESDARARAERKSGESSSSSSHSRPRVAVIDWSPLLISATFVKALNDVRDALNKAGPSDYSKGTPYYNALRKKILKADFHPELFYSLYAQFYKDLSSDTSSKKLFGLIQMEIHPDKNRDDSEISNLITQLFVEVGKFRAS